MQRVLSLRQPMRRVLQQRSFRIQNGIQTRTFSSKNLRDHDAVERDYFNRQERVLLQNLINKLHLQHDEQHFNRGLEAIFKKHNRPALTEDLAADLIKWKQTVDHEE